MLRTLLQAKLHRLTVTHTETHYEGSCAIDENLLEAAGIREYQQIELWNVNNGERLTTYAMSAARGSGVISVNGAAARKAAVGDIIIIAAFAGFDEDEAARHRPELVYVDRQNRIIRRANSIPTQAGAACA